MNKQKHQQNQSLIENAVLNDTTPDSVKIESQSESQPDPTKPQEHGRSMVEMLGVLAIIGVLSIGGIQGYTYAMNKYRANNVLNEVNMASHQLATELVTSRNAQKMLSLGNPYDNGTMTTENYPFAYGCGNYDSTVHACQQAEQGYWVSVGGLTKKICQNMLSEAGFLPYVAKTQLNGVDVTEETNCAENDNTIMFLFNSDESGELAENIGNEENKEEPTPTMTCPENTSKDGQGGLAVTLTDETTGEMIQCYCTAVDTKYTDSGTCNTLPEICKKNADCNRGEYCDFTKYGNTYCTKDTSRMTGSCRNANNNIQSPKPGTTPPFIMSNKKMMWWSAVNFCQALGKTLVEISDYGCAHTICPSGCHAKTGFCHANTSMGIASGSAYNISANIASMKAAYGDVWSWTNMDYDSCDAYLANFTQGNMVNGDRDYNNYAVCK